MSINIDKLTKVGYNSVCLIEINSENGCLMGTGFFIKFRLSPDDDNYLYGLLTCNHILNSKKLHPGFSFNIFLGRSENKKKYEITIKDSTFIFSSKFINTTFIQMDDEYINEITPYFLKPLVNECNINDKINILYYSNGNDYSLSNGKIRSLWGHSIINTLHTDNGSSGSPLFKNNFRVVGMHSSKFINHENNERTTMKIGIKIIIISYAIRHLYNQRQIIGNEKARLPAKDLTYEEINELISHGLQPTTSPYFFLKENNNLSPNLLLSRTNHAWYWTELTATDNENITELINTNISNRFEWSIISNEEIGHENINEQNEELINWLSSTDLTYL